MPTIAARRIVRRRCGVEAAVRMSIQLMPVIFAWTAPGDKEPGTLNGQLVALRQDQSPVDTPVIKATIRFGDLFIQAGCELHRGRQRRLHRRRSHALDPNSAWTGAVARDVVNDERQDNTRTSLEMVADCSSHGWVLVKTCARGGHITKVLSSFADALKARSRFFQDIVRDLGQHDAVERCKSARGKTTERRSYERQTPQRDGDAKRIQPAPRPRVCHRAMTEADCSRRDVREFCGAFARGRRQSHPVR